MLENRNQGILESHMGWHLRGHSVLFFHVGEEAECGDDVATTPCECGNMSKVTKVRSISVALTSETVHEAKNVPSPWSLPGLLLPEIYGCLDALKASSSSGGALRRKRRLWKL